MTLDDEFKADDVAADDEGLTASLHSHPETTETTETDRVELSNSEFLDAIFGKVQENERPMVVKIAGAITDETRWGRGIPWSACVDTADEKLNWFFTLSTFRLKDGGYRRTKEQFFRAYGVYLDDIGTKAGPREALDACPPSYLIETSAGNFQAGYLFDQPVENLAQVEALQDALVDAGLCDPGAKGPSARLGRLPCGSNGKYRPPHNCRLMEWIPERRYSIEQMVDLLGLKLAGKQGSRRSRKSDGAGPTQSSRDEEDIYSPRAKENAVLAALRKRGLYKQPLGDGKHDITCPWVKEHTGGLDRGTAYFEPNHAFPVGGFKCQHSHGDAKRLAALLSELGVNFAQAKHKPTIRVSAGELHRVVDAAEQELVCTGRHYQRGGLIVNVVTDPGTNETAIKPVNANSLVLELSAAAIWEKWDGRAQDFVPTDPPTRHVAVLYDSPTYAHLPVLNGIARQPYLRQDGSLMTMAGFDRVSGMFGVFDERDFNVPPVPTLEHARAAVQELQSLLSEFGFAEPHDAAAALAMMLTAAVRPSLVAAPMAHVKAPQIASGKSYLCGLIAAFAGPAKPSAYAFPSSDEECVKLLFAALLESPAVVMFDNLTGDLLPYKSLCSALTEETLTGRILGVSKTAIVGTRALFLSSGNNVGPVRDMARRVVTITIDPKCETPAARRFNGDPLTKVLQDRARYVSLALTVIRAYLVSGNPVPQLQPLGSYGEWTRLVRAPVVWLGLPDPATSIFNGMAADPDRETLDRLLVAWHRVFDCLPTSVREAVAKVEVTGFSPDMDFAEAVREIADERGTINRKRLGRWIARHQGRQVNGKKFERDIKAGGSERWKVVTVVSRVFGGQGAESASANSSCHPDDYADC